MKSLYYQFVNYVAEMPTVWYVTIWTILFCGALIFIMKFFKIYNGTQKKFEKLSLLVIAILLFSALIFLTYIRKQVSIY